MVVANPHVHLDSVDQEDLDGYNWRDIQQRERISESTAVDQ
jgi:hypothetical protein